MRVLLDCCCRPGGLLAALPLLLPRRRKPGGALATPRLLVARRGASEPSLRLASSFRRRRLEDGNLSEPSVRRASSSLAGLMEPSLRRAFFSFVGGGGALLAPHLLLARRRRLRTATWPSRRNAAPPPLSAAEPSERRASSRLLSRGSVAIVCICGWTGRAREGLEIRDRTSGCQPHVYFPNNFLVVHHFTEKLTPLATCHFLDACSRIHPVTRLLL
jgi:hypothetical protein